MKKIILILTVLVFTVPCIFSQKVFTVKYPNQADVKVFVVKYENQADLKVYLVKYSNQADLKIYFVKYENQAGWRENTLMHLMYPQ